MILVIEIIDDADTTAFSMPRTIPSNFSYPASPRNSIPSFRIQTNKRFEINLCFNIPDFCYCTLIWQRFDNNLRN